MIAFFDFVCFKTICLNNVRKQLWKGTIATWIMPIGLWGLSIMVVIYPDSIKAALPKERGLVADEAPLFWWY